MDFDYASKGIVLTLETRTSEVNNLVSIDIWNWSNNAENVDRKYNN